MKRFNTKLNLAGVIIKKHREKLGYSKVEVSNKLELLGINISRVELYRMEKGVTTIKDFELIGLCSILNINLTELENELPNIL